MSESSASAAVTNKNVTLEPNDPQRLAALCGPFDQNIKHLERRLDVTIRNRGNQFQVSGASARVEAGAALLHQLYRETYERDEIEPDFVHLLRIQKGLYHLSSPNLAI